MTVVSKKIAPKLPLHEVLQQVVETGISLDLDDEKITRTCRCVSFCIDAGFNRRYTPEVVSALCFRVCTHTTAPNVDSALVDRLAKWFWKYINQNRVYSYMPDMGSKLESIVESHIRRVRDARRQELVAAHQFHFSASDPAMLSPGERKTYDHLREAFRDIVLTCNFFNLTSSRDACSHYALFYKLQAFKSTSQRVRECAYICSPVVSAWELEDLLKLPRGSVERESMHLNCVLRKTGLQYPPTLVGIARQLYKDELVACGGNPRAC